MRTRTIATSETRDQSTSASQPSRAREVRPASEPFGLADWLWGLAFERGLIGQHRAPKRDDEVRKQLTAASELLAVYPVAEIQARGQRFIAAIVAGEITKAAPTVANLARFWDWACVAPPKAPVAAAPAKRYLNPAELE